MHQVHLRRNEEFLHSNFCCEKHCLENCVTNGIEGILSDSTEDRPHQTSQTGVRYSAMVH